MYYFLIFKNLLTILFTIIFHKWNILFIKYTIIVSLFLPFTDTIVSIAYF